jgi:acetyltransferase-like isoleucine patch superfamily enzyme
MSIVNSINFLCRYWIRFKGDNIKYLRSLGMKIGDRCDIITNVKNIGSEPWLIEIGNGVTICSGVVFLTHDGSSRIFRNQIHEMNVFGNRFGKIKINDNCFIGINSIIFPGVEIGPESIIGVGSIVLKTVPPKTVVAGNPARIICTLNEYIERYKRKMLRIKAQDRDSLKEELINLLMKNKNKY